VDPAKQAADLLRWKAVVNAYENCDPNPPGDHPETLEIWQTVTDYYEVLQRRSERA
jgi:hypothetical protein